MSLQVCPIRLDELPRAHELMCSGGRGLYDQALLSELPRLWRELLQARRLEMHVFRDDSLPPARKIQGLASGVFVNDAFADALVAEGEPMVACRVMRAEVEGRSVILTRAQTALANANAGVNALGLDFAFAPDDWPAPTTARWAPLLLESLRMWLDGWRVRMRLRECVGNDQNPLARAMGVPVLHRHAIACEQGPAPPRRFYLTGVTREQTRRQPADLSSLLFFAEREPRFRFSMAEQDLLQLALHNHADDECALQLNVSPHTVKMRWRSIFERVAEQQTAWLPAAGGRGQRGVEKRRHLLAYLAQHMEEVRPRARKLPADDAGLCSGPQNSAMLSLRR